MIYPNVSSPAVRVFGEVGRPAPSAGIVFLSVCLTLHKWESTNGYTTSAALLDWETKDGGTVYILQKSDGGVVRVRETVLAQASRELAKGLISERGGVHVLVGDESKGSTAR